MVYKSGPSNNPCGTPNCRGTAVEYSPLIQTACVRPIHHIVISHCNIRNKVFTHVVSILRKSSSLKSNTHTLKTVLF